MQNFSQNILCCQTNYISLIAAVIKIEIHTHTHTHTHTQSAVVQLHWAVMGRSMISGLSPGLEDVSSWSIPPSAAGQTERTIRRAREREWGRKAGDSESKREDRTGLGRACVISRDMRSSVTCPPPTSHHLLVGAREQGKEGRKKRRWDRAMKECRVQG